MRGKEGRKRGFRERRMGVDISLAPLLDVLLILFIVLVVVASGGLYVKQLAVLPRDQGAGESVDSITVGCIVTIQKDGTYLVEGKTATSLAELEALVNESLLDKEKGCVSLAADRELLYHCVTDVMQHLATMDQVDYVGLLFDSA